jgi:transposase
MTPRRITLPKLTIGLDVGDRFTHLCALDARGQIVTTERLRTTPVALERVLATLPRCRVVLEVGTHPPG